MDGFSNLSQLYERVKPALRAKCRDFKRLGFDDIDISDIWNYLKNNVWNRGKNLTLADIVDDIMCVDIDLLKKYLDEKNTGE